MSSMTSMPSQLLTVAANLAEMAGWPAETGVLCSKQQLTRGVEGPSREML